jgi:hypothetical protein
VPGWKEAFLRFNQVPSRCALVPLEAVLPEIEEG